MLDTTLCQLRDSGFSESFSRGSVAERTVGELAQVMVEQSDWGVTAEAPARLSLWEDFKCPSLFEDLLPWV